MPKQIVASNFSTFDISNEAECITNADKRLQTFFRNTFEAEMSVFVSCQLLDKRKYELAFCPRQTFSIV
jgi:hypothetical protein